MPHDEQRDRPDRLHVSLDALHIDLHHHADPQMGQVLGLLRLLINRQEIQMALGQDILDAVTEETTRVDSFIALVQGLIDNNTIPAAVGSAILAQVNSNKAKLEAAIAANTPAAPPVV